MAINPAISVITAVYNGKEHIENCLKSIANQTFTDYEHIIVNDGSTDETLDILRRWQYKDRRIRILHNSQNMGRSISRNRAILAAKSPLLAILDADDVALPLRLETQVAFLEKHPEVQILGSGMYINDNDHIYRHVPSNDQIRAILFFDAAIFHSTAVIRKNLLIKTKKFYNPALPLAQDYGLWVDLMAYPEAIFTNIREPLIRYRQAIGTRGDYEYKQFSCANWVRGKIFEFLDLPVNNENLRYHLALLFGNAKALEVSPSACAKWGKTLIKANMKHKLAGQDALAETITIRIEKLFLNSK